MTFNNKSGNSVAMRVVCAIAFLVFTFSYLYFYQCDLIGAVQHVLSGGQTSYSRLIGAIILTVCLYLLQIGIYALTKLNRHAHALTYFPSLLLLCLLTSVDDTFDQHFSQHMDVDFALIAHIVCFHCSFINEISAIFV